MIDTLTSLIPNPNSVDYTCGVGERLVNVTQTTLHELRWSQSTIINDDDGNIIHGWLLPDGCITLSNEETGETIRIEAPWALNTLVARANYLTANELRKAVTHTAIVNQDYLYIQNSDGTVSKATSLGIVNDETPELNIPYTESFFVIFSDPHKKEPLRLSDLNRITERDEDYLVTVRREDNQYAPVNFIDTDYSSPTEHGAYGWLFGNE